jgi:hypothetical protein
VKVTQLDVGDRVWFVEERLPYEVKAVSADGRWAVCTKLFAAQHTVLYTVIDFENEVRGIDDRVFSPGYETEESCRVALSLFEQGISAHSRRHPPIPVNIWKASTPKGAGMTTSPSPIPDSTPQEERDRQNRAADEARAREARERNDEAARGTR